MREVIHRAIQDCNNLQDSNKSWDFIKCCIRTESITFSIRKNKLKRQEMDRLERQKFELEEKISTTPNSLNFELYNEVKHQLDELHNEKAVGTYIRSRAKFVQEYKNKQIFFKPGQIKQQNQTYSSIDK